MILKVARFKEGQIERVETAYNPKELDLDFIDFHYLKSIALNGLAERIRHTVTFRGTLIGRIEQICGRCLVSIERDFSAPFDLSYEVQDKEVVDATNDLRDILILEHPDQFLCRPNCKGICSRCGANLNEAECQCPKEVLS